METAQIYEMKRFSQEGREIVLCRDDEPAFFCKVDGQRHNRLADVVAALPGLQTDAGVANYALLINHFGAGPMFFMIRDIEIFKREYEAEVEVDVGDIQAYQTYGKFNLDGLHPPRIEGDQVVFFVRNTYTRQPHRVLAPLDPGSEQRVSYQILPYR